MRLPRRLRRRPRRGGLRRWARRQKGGGGKRRFHATLELPFSAEVHWTDATGGLIESADLSGNVGTIVYRGATLPAVVYREIPFAQYELRLAAIVATSNDNLRVLYAYCQNGTIAGWYYEALDEPAASGTQLARRLRNPEGPGRRRHQPASLVGPPAGLLYADQATVTGAFSDAVVYWFRLVLWP